MNSVTRVYVFTHKNVKAVYISVLKGSPDKFKKTHVYGSLWGCLTKTITPRATYRRKEIFDFMVQHNLYIPEPKRSKQLHWRDDWKFMLAGEYEDTTDLKKRLEDLDALYAQRQYTMLNTALLQ